jgi:hypothetical protein
MCDSDSGGPQKPSLLVSLALLILPYPLLTPSDRASKMDGDLLDGDPDLWDTRSDRVRRFGR